MNPKISIGIPVYNGEKFITETLNSILSQTFKDFEIIISDNASNDLTEKICKSYKNKDTRVLYFRQSFNVGGIENFKMTLRKARGKFFMWIAADDMLGCEDYLKIFNSELSNKFDYYFSDVSVVDQHGKLINSNILDNYNKCFTKYDFLYQSLKLNSHQFYALFKKEVLLRDWNYLEICKNENNFNEGLFVHYISGAREGKFINNTIKLYRYHNNSWSKKLLAYKLIFSYVRYFLRTIKLLIFFKNFTLFQKLNLIFSKIIIDTKYLLYLLFASIWQICKLNRIKILDTPKKKLKKYLFYD